MIEGGHEWCEKMEGRQKKGGKFSKEEIEEVGRRIAEVNRMKEAKVGAELGKLRGLGWRMRDLESKMKGKDENTEKRKRMAVRQREERVERGFHDEQRRRKKRGQRLQTMAEVGRGEKVGEMPALIKIKGLNIREDQKWKSFFKLENVQANPTPSTLKR